ncbi:MAG: hypothetical protein IKF52_01280 [Clostridia bacterium]|nr:hypothetical protein [Clostridia bacterium]MBR3152225.1 hypothetical protein [Clostridia bacterium]MBR3152238.1 hypothetical protein [Clostridia bacterium]
MISCNISDLSNSIFSGVNDTVNIVIGLIGPMCFWSGMMNILKSTSFIDRFGKSIKPAIRRIFPGINEKNNSYKNIVLNITSNMLRIRKCSNSFRFEGNGRNEKREW